MKERLEARKYSNNKIRENLEAEAMGVCSLEAYDLHGEKVNEVDVSNLKIDEAVDVIIDVINGNDDYPFGNVDFMEWLISNN